MNSQYTIKSFITILCLAFSLQLAAYTPVRRTEISNHCVHAITQDSAGYVWLATANGLCKKSSNLYEIYFGEVDDNGTIPSSYVNNIFVDKDGWLMVATNMGVAGLEKGTRVFHRYHSGDDSAFEFDCNGFIEFAGRLLCYGTGGLYEVDNEQKKISSLVNIDVKGVSSATVGPDGNLWISNGKELMAVDKTLRPIRRLQYENAEEVNAMASSLNNIIIGRANGMAFFNPYNSTVTLSNSGKSLSVNKIFPVNDSINIIATNNRGVLLFNSRTNSLSKKFDEIDLNKLESSEINDVFIDNLDNLWIATFDMGEVILSDRKQSLNLNRNLIDAFRDEFVTRAVQDSHGIIWVGTRSKGLAAYNPATGQKHYFNSHSSNELNSFNKDFVQDINIDSQGRMWLGYNNRLIVCSPEYSGNNVSNLHLVKNFPDFVNVVTMQETPDGEMWVGTDNAGLFIIDRNLNLVDNISSPLFRSNNITKIIPFDKDQMLLSSYGDNLYLVNIYDHSVKYLPLEGNISIGNAVDMLIDRQRNLWIGTYSHGLLRLDTSTGKLMSCSLPEAHDIVALALDDNGHIWASSSYGLYHFDSDGSTINTYLKSDGLGGNQFHEKCVTKLLDNSFLFGGNAGLEQVSPSVDIERDHNIPLRINGVWIMPQNKPVLSGNNADLDIGYIDQISLSHKDNSINIEFASLCYDNADLVEYSYMLKGHDKDFIYLGNFNRVSYSDLSPGKYDFLVRARLKGGDWLPPVNLLDINVKQNPWLSLPAMLAYLIIFIAIIIYLNHIYLRYRLIRQRYELSEERIEREKQITANRINFFTNISHELRTPLTLICGPAKHLQANYQSMSQQQIDESFDFINTNVERLLALIDQLLNFRRVNNETLPLQVEKGDLCEQIATLTKRYSLYVGDNGMSISFDKPEQESKIVTYDSDKIEKIFSNLIINAIKYSGDEGAIKISLRYLTCPEGIENASPDTLYAEFAVADDGPGIETEDIPLIFTSFRRLPRIRSEKAKEGFGIGLHFVSELVKMHKGIIRVEKNPSGGTIFRVTIPVSDDAFEVSEFRSPASEIILDDLPAATPSSPEITEPADDSADPVDMENRRKILIVEDNVELNTFLAGMLGEKYLVLQAYNGEEGLQIALDEMPEIVVSDVLMPGDIDGFELCSRLKSDSSTSHIAVILLSAKTFDESKIKGYNCGADAYLCKPFSPDVLMARIENLTTRLQKRASMILSNAGVNNDETEVTLNPEELSPLDKKFLDKLYAYIDKNIDNCDLNVNMLGRELGFSRTNFYRKIKALTGISPNDLLRVYRLNRAAELLLTREYTIGEVGERTGFGNQSHFSSLFKKHFGISPRSYVTEHFPH